MRDLLRDEKAIWTSPLRIDRGDATWLVPFAAGTAALVATDDDVIEKLSFPHRRVTASRDVSYLGSATVLIPTTAAFYLVGRLAHNDRARETGLLSAAALLHTTIVVGALKAATNRERPNKVNGRQDFWDGGTAFPSGHAAESFAVATVVAEEYHDNPLVRWGAYAIAAAVSISRVTVQKHSPSDVVVGGVIGYLIGHYEVKQHGTYRTDQRTTSIVPIFDHASRTYGLGVSMQF